MTKWYEDSIFDQDIEAYIEERRKRQAEVLVILECSKEASIMILLLWKKQYYEALYLREKDKRNLGDQFISVAESHPDGKGQVIQKTHEIEDIHS